MEEQYRLKDYCKDVQRKDAPFLAGQTLHLHKDDRLYHGTRMFFGHPHFPKNIDNRFSTNRKLSVQWAENSRSVKRNPYDLGYLYTYARREEHPFIPNVIVSCASRFAELMDFINSNTQQAATQLDASVYYACSGNWNGVYVPKWEQQLVLCSKNLDTFLKLVSVERIFNIDGQKVFKDLGNPPVDCEIPCQLKCKMRLQGIIQDETLIPPHTSLCFYCPNDEDLAVARRMPVNGWVVRRVDTTHRILEIEAIENDLEAHSVMLLIHEMEAKGRVLCASLHIRWYADYAKIRIVPDTLQVYVHLLDTNSVPKSEGVFGSPELHIAFPLTINNSFIQLDDGDAEWQQVDALDLEEC
jgi:hypothetical protein